MRKPNDGKLVSLEEHHPSLKEQRRQKSRRRLFIYLAVFFVLIGLVIYFQSPLSHIRSIETSGAQFTEKQVVKEESGAQVGTNIWEMDRNVIKNNVEKLPEIQEAEVTRSWPATVNIEVTEYEKVAYTQVEGAYAPVLENGHELTDNVSSELPADAPLLQNFEKEERLEAFAAELGKLGEGVTNRISEVYFDPSENEEDNITLYMNDGLEVRSSVSEFSEYMGSYPSIARNIDASQNGVLYMMRAPYFEAAEPEEGSGEEMEGTQEMPEESFIEGNDTPEGTENGTSDTEENDSANGAGQ
ncbi:cell division protein FtsQ/DivIB [Marinococcus luteus]|uniref:cell division protein FtsQ/DivIB n=1 Tax=Marinococcus luteus TaxID=1122204 RepID=UPI002ACC4E4A|nr:cell division protein FtsQ/DivIB [Marinococcus luteus]MDZ5781733.1 cell division protein FtsQ/DivIB [Marinococcus luteus]